MILAHAPFQSEQENSGPSSMNNKKELCLNPTQSYFKKKKRIMSKMSPQTINKPEIKTKNAEKKTKKTPGTRWLPG